MKRILFLLLLVTNLANAQFIGLRRVKPGGGGTETDPTVSAAAKAITSTDTTNWNTAFGWGSHASAGYLTSASAASTYMPIAGTTTITGDKTFTGALTIPATTLTGNILLSTTNNRTLGNATNKFLQVFSAQFLGTASTVFGTEGTSSILFRQGTTIYPAGFHATTGNFFTQTPGSGAPTDNLAGAQFLHTKTAASAIARGVYIGNTLTAAANNDVLVSLDVAPTFTNGAFTGVSNYALRTTGTFLSAGNIVFDGDNTRSIGSTTMRAGVVYAINVSKGNTANSFNLTTTGSTGIFLRAQPTTNNIVIQDAGTAPSETGYKLTVDGTGATNGGLSVTNGITASQYKLSSLNTAPSSATDTGTTGEIRITSGFIFVCISSNVWVRSALATW